jgi:CHAT domain-containing protein
MAKTPTDPQLIALEVFKLMIKDPTDRRDYATAKDHEEKKHVFDRRRNKLVRGRSKTHESLRDAHYDEIGDPARKLLEGLSNSELALLSDLDSAFVEAGLSIERNPVPLMIH